MNAFAWTIAAACLVAAAPDAAADATKKDQEKIQGLWKTQSICNDGVDVSADVVAKTTMKIDGDKMLIDLGTATVHYDIKLDASKKPTAIDFINPDRKEHDGYGIYKLDGDTLTIAWAKIGNDRPTEFVSRENSGVFLAVYRREKK